MENQKILDDVLKEISKILDGAAATKEQKGSKKFPIPAIKPR